MRSMMEADLRERALSRYRLMFRAVGICLALGILTTGAGLFDAFLQSTLTTVQAGLLLVVLSILVGYRITVSTMHLIEADGMGRYE